MSIEIQKLEEDLACCEASNNAMAERLIELESERDAALARASHAETEQWARVWDVVKTLGIKDSGCPDSQIEYYVMKLREESAANLAIAEDIVARVWKAIDNKALESMEVWDAVAAVREAVTVAEEDNDHLQTLCDSVKRFAAAALREENATLRESLTVASARAEMAEDSEKAAIAHMEAAVREDAKSRAETREWMTREGTAQKERDAALARASHAETEQWARVWDVVKTLGIKDSGCPDSQIEYYVMKLRAEAAAMTAARDGAQLDTFNEFNRRCKAEGQAARSREEPGRPEGSGELSAGKEPGTVGGWPMVGRYLRLRAAIERAVPDYLPDTVVEATGVIRDCAQEFAIRLLRLRAEAITRGDARTGLLAAWEHEKHRADNLKAALEEIVHAGIYYAEPCSVHLARAALAGEVGP